MSMVNHGKDNSDGLDACMRYRANVNDIGFLLRKKGSCLSFSLFVPKLNRKARKERERKREREKGEIEHKLFPVPLI